MPIIRIIRKRRLPTMAFPDLQQASYIGIDLGDYLADSQVGKVGLHKDCYHAIRIWVEASLKDRNKGEVPEVGGFILGQYTQDPQTSMYSISLDQFVPSQQVAYSSNTYIDFGMQAMLELEAAQGRFPHLKLVGWFHTHPGHTPYLSVTDLKTHHGFFRKPYQVAIVLDCLTQGFDTGIFSWRTDGHVNNYASFSSWILWKELQ